MPVHYRGGWDSRTRSSTLMSCASASINSGQFSQRQKTPLDIVNNNDVGRQSMRF
jgi:hypothetical protein